MAKQKHARQALKVVSYNSILKNLKKRNSLAPANSNRKKFHTDSANKRLMIENHFLVKSIICVSFIHVYINSCIKPLLNVKSIMTICVRYIQSNNVLLHSAVCHMEYNEALNLVTCECRKQSLSIHWVEHSFHHTQWIRLQLNIHVFNWNQLLSIQRYARFC